MIYAARSLGLGSTPMIGFDAEAVAREFALAEDEVPVMLLSVGGGASRKLVTEAAPSGGRCAGIRIDPRAAPPSPTTLRTPESAREKYLERRKDPLEQPNT